MRLLRGCWGDGEDVFVLPGSNSFRAARDFISFDKRQKKRSKEKRFLDEANTR